MQLLETVTVNPVAMRLRVTYFQGGRSKPQRLLIAIGGSATVAEARQEMQKALAAMGAATASVKRLWSRDGFLLPDSHGIGALVDSGDEIYASEKKTNVAPQLPAAASDIAAAGDDGKVVKRKRHEAPPTGAAEPTGAETTTDAGTEPKPKKPRAARGASAYNLFMGPAMSRWKAENPGKPHKEAFTACSRLWRTSSENPKNGGSSGGGGDKETSGAQRSTPTSASHVPPAKVEDDGQDSDAESGALPTWLCKPVSRRRVELATLTPLVSLVSSRNEPVGRGSRC